MYRIYLIGILLIIVLLPVAHASTMPFGQLNETGRGEAYYLRFIKVYNATLYSSDNAREDGILDGNVSKCLHLEYSVGVEQEDMIEAAWEVLKRQFSQQQLDLVKNEIEIIHQGYRDVNQGDSYALCYASDAEETTLVYNGLPVAAVTSAQFATIYFSIWLGQDQPLDEDLRNDLLSGLRKG